MIEKCLAVGIILLFVGIAIAPTTNANDDKIVSKPFSLPKNEDMIPITILEYKADGTVERTVFRMSPEQADTFHEEMRNAQDLEMRLSIYKKYNLISQDVTVDSLQAGMQEKAQRMGLTQDGLMSRFRSNQSLFPPFVYRNIFCAISGSDFGIFIVIPFFRFNFESTRPSFDAVDFIIGAYPVSSKGLLGEFECLSFTLKIVGFVGIIDYDWQYDGDRLFYLYLDGFCVYFKARGIKY
jgi:hypothetical protein